MRIYKIYKYACFLTLPFNQMALIELVLTDLAFSFSEVLLLFPNSSIYSYIRDLTFLFHCVIRNQLS